MSREIRNRERRRRGDRDRDYDRPRDRDDRSQPTDNPLSGQSGPVILLKRPGSCIPASSSQSQPQLSQTLNPSSSKEKDPSTNATGGDSTTAEYQKSGPTILQRSSLHLKRNTDSNQDITSSTSQQEQSEVNLVYNSMHLF